MRVRETITDKVRQLCTTLDNKPDGWRAIGSNTECKVPIKEEHIQRMIVDIEIVGSRKSKGCVKILVSQRASFKCRWYNRKFSVKADTDLKPESEEQK